MTSIQEKPPITSQPLSVRKKPMQKFTDVCVRYVERLI